MFHRIDFTKTGGFPLTQNTMQYIQDSYNEVLQAVSRIAGQYIILSGLTQSAPNVYTNGWVCVNGEIIPFEGGLGQTNVSVVETTDATYTFRDGASYPVLFGRKVMFSSSGTIPFSAFQRISLESLKSAVDAAQATATNALNTANTALAAASTSAFAQGMIMMWGGSISQVPAGWALCDGVNGRPNLKGRFVVGYDNTTSDYNTIGKSGGAASVTLTIPQMPSHGHQMTTAGIHRHWTNGVGGIDGNRNGGGLGAQDGVKQRGNYTYTEYEGEHSHTLHATGGGQPHENRPPYYVLAYIIKV